MAALSPGAVPEPRQGGVPLMAEQAASLALAATLLGVTLAPASRADQELASALEQVFMGDTSRVLALNFA
ncbi:MAG TPA: hypothetical protein VLA62_02775 [Solirubrobacterales bacterium]|nr:hypothetical protein [Solirubrobacterales bacterium]